MMTQRSNSLSGISQNRSVSLPGVPVRQLVVPTRKTGHASSLSAAHSAQSHTESSSDIALEDIIFDMSSRPGIEGMGRIEDLHEVLASLTLLPTSGCCQCSSKKSAASSYNEAALAFESTSSSEKPEALGALFHDYLSYVRQEPHHFLRDEVAQDFPVYRALQAVVDEHHVTFDLSRELHDVLRDSGLRRQDEDGDNVRFLERVTTFEEFEAALFAMTPKTTSVVGRYQFKGSLLMSMMAWPTVLGGGSAGAAFIPGAMGYPNPASSCLINTVCVAPGALLSATLGATAIGCAYMGGRVMRANCIDTRAGLPEQPRLFVVGSTDAEGFNTYTVTV